MVGTVKTRGAGGMATHTEELITHLRKLGITVEHYKTAPAKEYPKVIDKLLRAYTRTIGLSIKLLKDSKNFDIVHIQASGPLGGLLPAIIGAVWRKLLRFNLIVTFHYRPDKEFLKKHKRIFDLIFSQAEVFFVVSQKQRENITEIFGDKAAQKTMLTYNGFDSNIFHPMDKRLCREKLGLPVQKKIILNVANMYPVKGHKYLIESMKYIINHRRDILLVIVGDGPSRDELEEQVKQLQLDECVKLIGPRPHSEIPLWMNAADLFVLSSLSEGNPTVMFEALGVGLPFVGTAVGGIPEIIISKDYGLLCPPKDPECLAEKILIALNKEWDREKIRKYAEQFTWDNIAKRTLEVYRTVTTKLNE
ncbi:glycosyltransferase [Thermococcus cleftensis]|nr:glycosyltransferase [Thermococcus cleftensis]